MGDHTAHLQRELTSLGNKVLVLTGTPGQDGLNSFSVDAFGGSMLNTLRLLIAKHHVDRILWQYVPYSYQPKGLPFWWPWLMLRLRQKGLKQIIFFHEVSIRLWGYGAKRLVLAFLQRVIANFAALIANRTITSIRLFRSYFVFNKPVIVPISANVVSSQWSPDSYREVSGVKASGEMVRDERSVVSGEGVVNKVPIAIGRSIVSSERMSGELVSERLINEELVLGGMIQPAKKNELVTRISEFDLEPVVSFTGTIEADRLANIVADVSVFIQPQMVERGNEGGVSAKNGTIMAAMAMGKAIITCAGDMTDPKLFRNGENMLLVTYGDAVGYEKALLCLLKDRTLADRLGQAAATTYQGYCSWEVTGGMIEGTLR